MKIFTLLISPKYVAHWGFWEAVRELLQNAYDEEVKQGMTFENILTYENGCLKVESPNSKLEKESLILGSTDKDLDTKMIGKFGEGYKLALLVLCRMKFPVVIVNNDEIWTPRVERDNDFGCDVLKIYVEDVENLINYRGVCFRIDDVNELLFAEVKVNLCEFRDVNKILHDACQVGRIYVGGLYIKTMEEFKCGYAFKPGAITLDRDRGMVDSFNLSYACSKLWANSSLPDEITKASQLLIDRAPDVEYLQNHTYSVTPFVSSFVNQFDRTHGETTIPVSSQEEIIKVQRSGLKWVLVTESIKKLISMVRNIFVPMVGTPLERLESFIENNRFKLGEDGVKELEDIYSILAKCLGGK